MKTSRIFEEGPIDLRGIAELATALRGGRAVHKSTVSRWIRFGVKVDGDVVRLEAVRVGSRTVSSEAALMRFLDRQNELLAAAVG